MKNKRITILMIMLILATFSLSVWGASATRYLNARLMVFASRLYKQMRPEIESTAEEQIYSIGLLPLVDVNGENPKLTIYLQDKVEGVIDDFSTLKLKSPQLVKETWIQLHEEELDRKEMIQELGRRLDLSAVVLASITTHPDAYTINGLVVDVSSGRSSNKVELISLDKGKVKKLPLGQIETIELPSLITESDNDPEPVKPVTEKEDEKEEENVDEQKDEKNEKDEEDDNSTKSEEEPVEKEEMADKIDQLTEVDETVLSKPEIDDENRINENLKPDESYQYVLTLKDNSPLFNDLLLGFDVGDLTGDNELELAYLSGNILKVRSLVDYNLLASYTGYRPLSNDFKILTVDIDGDKIDEIIGHGNLFEMVEEKLVSKQPRFLARPVETLESDRIALYDKDTLYLVNHQGLVQDSYKPGKEYGKRLTFADLEGNGQKQLIITRESSGQGGLLQVFAIDEDGELEEGSILSGQYGFAVHTMDLNQNGKEEIYLRRNFFDGDEFLYSKIYVVESIDGTLKVITESSRLDYFVIDFTSYPKENPDRLLVGGMYMNNKKQSTQEIQSQLFYYNLKKGDLGEEINN